MESRVMHPGSITIKPQGGLGNRMRAIDSALLIAKSTGKNIRVIWELTFELNCSFNKLFYLPEAIELHEYYVNRLFKSSSRFLYRNLRKAGIYLPLGFSLHLFDDDILNMKIENVDFVQLIGSEKAVFINTCNQFCKDTDSFKAFKPVAELQRIIDSYVQGFNSNTIGVHIRRKDNLRSIKHSPLEGFITLMKNEIKHKPETLFFFATDSEEVEKELLDIFNSRIITHKKLLDRNTEAGIQDALIDLFCLSRTKKIFGSHYSSYSEVAAQINNIDLIQVLQ